MNDGENSLDDWAYPPRPMPPHWITLLVWRLMRKGYVDKDD